MDFKKLVNTVLSGSILIVGLISCASKENTPNPTININSNTAGISIVTGSQSVGLGQSVPLEANFVDADGNLVTATNITWTSSNTEVATIENNQIVTVGAGQAVITAKATVNGKEITSQIIVGVTSSSAKPIFTVAPAVIIWGKNAGNIQLIPVYLGNGSNPDYSYSSGNTSIIQVSSSGDVSFIAAGEASITVKANGIEGKPTFTIPVLVIGELSGFTSTAVTRVTINPVAATMFKDQTKTFTARAFSSSNAEVTGNSVTWEIVNDTNNILPQALSVTSSGEVTANSVGNGILFATIKGIRAQAEIQVLPDTILIVNPIYAEVVPGGSQQYTAEMYKINRINLSVSAINPPSSLTWKIEKLADIFPNLSIFDIATVNQNGLVSVKSDATPGYASPVEVFVPGTSIYGSSLVSVKISVPPIEPPVTFPGPGFTIPGFEDF